MHLMRAKIIACAFMFAGLTTIIALFSLTRDKQFPVVDICDIALKKNTFLKFFYKTSDASGKEVTITAEKVVEETKDNFVFEKIVSNFMLPNKKIGIVTSDFGKLIRKDRSVCKFKGNVVMTGNDDLSMKTNDAIFDSGSGVISGKSAINVKKGETELSANRYSFDIEKNTLMLVKNAKACNKNEKLFSDELIIALDGENANSIKRFVAKGNISVLSNEYDLQAKNSLIYERKRIRAMKNVNFAYKGNNKNFTVKSDQMSALLNNKSKISEVAADGNVVIRTKDSVVKADHAVYRKNSDKIIASGNVMISKKQGDIFGEAAELDLKTERVSVKKSSGVVDSEGQLRWKMG